MNTAPRDIFAQLIKQMEAGAKISRYFSIAGKKNCHSRRAFIDADRVEFSELCYVLLKMYDDKKWWSLIEFGKNYTRFEFIFKHSNYKENDPVDRIRKFLCDIIMEMEKYYGPEKTWFGIDNAEAYSAEIPNSDANEEIRELKDEISSLSSKIYSLENYIREDYRRKNRNNEDRDSENHY